MLTQREAGGNLSGVLDNLSSVIRERFKVKRQVERDLGARPHDGGDPGGPAAGRRRSRSSSSRRRTPRLLLTDPLGAKMLIGAVVLQVVGMLWIRKIIRDRVLSMSPILLVSLMGTFVAVALLSGAVAYSVLERQAPGRKRLQPEAVPKRGSRGAGGPRRAHGSAESRPSSGSRASSRNRRAR